ncbi:MAG: CoA transferase, partial [Actinomycetales bacterium]|nr:CoA transferase [Actinomycetales bacterium]
WAVSEQLITGKAARRHGNHNAASSPSGTFRTGDGLLNIAANTQVQFASVCKVIGRPDLLDDPRFTTRQDRKRNRAALTTELESALASRSAVQWEAELAKVSVPAGLVLSLADALNQEQIRVRGLIHDVDLGLAGRRSASVVGSGVHVDGASLAPRSGPPALGQDTDAVLSVLGLSTDEIEELRDARAI